MIPTIDHYVLSCIRALRETVIPAIDATDSFALEQAHLVIGLLTLIGDHWDKTYLMERMELGLNRELVIELLAAAEGGDLTQAASAVARRVCNAAGDTVTAAVEQRAINESNRGLQGAIKALLDACNADGTARFREQSLIVVIAHTRKTSQLGRVWFANTRLDPEWSNLPSVDSVLQREHP